MDLTFCALASGSSGNSYLVKSGTTTLLVDVGISGKRICDGLALAGAAADSVDGILITHEHSDHIRSLKVMQKRSPEAYIYTNLGTYTCIRDEIADGRHIAFETGASFAIGDITVTSFPVSHDAAEPVGFTFEKGESKLAIVTDTGYVSEEIFRAVSGSDLLVLESNHDEHILQFCRYPYHIKRRILSDRGHLCNEAAAEVMGRLLAEGEKRPVFLLAHLSQENNTPDLALITVENYLEESGVFEGREDSREDLRVDVLSRTEPSRIYHL